MKQDAVCPELTTLQTWVGNLTVEVALVGFGVLFLVIGVTYFLWRFVPWIRDLIWEYLKHAADVLGYAVSGAFFVSAYLFPSEKLLLAIIGCLVLIGSVEVSMHVRDLSWRRSRHVLLFYAVIWGVAALVLDLREIGFLASGALLLYVGVNLLTGRYTPRLTMWVTYDNTDESEGITYASLAMLATYFACGTLISNPPQYVAVFMPGFLWAGTIGLFASLIVNATSVNWGTPEKENENVAAVGYCVLQAITVGAIIGAIELGTYLHVPFLIAAGITALVLYVLAKIWDIPKGRRSMITGVQWVMSGAWLFAVRWWYLSANPEHISLSIF